MRFQTTAAVLLLSTACTGSGDSREQEAAPADPVTIEVTAVGEGRRGVLNPASGIAEMTAAAGGWGSLTVFTNLVDRRTRLLWSLRGTDGWTRPEELSLPGKNLRLPRLWSDGTGRVVLLVWSSDRRGPGRGGKTVWDLSAVPFDTAAGKWLAPESVSTATRVVDVRIAATEESLIVAFAAAPRPGESSRVTVAVRETGGLWNVREPNYTDQDSPYVSEPDLYVDDHGRLHLVWIEGKRAWEGPAYSFSDDAGLSWLPGPRYFGDKTEFRTQSPRVIGLRDRVMVVWSGEFSNGQAGRISISHSHNRGADWTAADVLHEDRANQLSFDLTVDEDSVRCIWTQVDQKGQDWNGSLHAATLAGEEEPEVRIAELARHQRFVSLETLAAGGNVWVAVVEDRAEKPSRLVLYRYSSEQGRWWNYGFSEEKSFVAPSFPLLISDPGYNIEIVFAEVPRRRSVFEPVSRRSDLVWGRIGPQLETE